MKRLLFFVAGCLMIACNMTEDVENQVVSKKLFHATIDDESTRTFVDEKIRLRWTEGDLISLFEGTTRNKQYKFLGETGDNAGDFEDITTGFGSGNDIDRYYAIYPYSSTTKLHEDGYITYTFPAEQNYAENSFGLGANPMVAVTGGLNDFDLCFRNAAGYLRLYLYGEDVSIKSIKIEGNNSEPLAGKAYITPEFGGFPTTEMDETATSTVTLNCGSGVKIGTTAETATPFWIALPPTVFSKGFTATFTDLSGYEFTKTFTSNINVARNKYISAKISIESFSPPYLTFIADANQSLTMTQEVETLEYSVGNGNWTKLGTKTVNFGGDLGNLRIRGKNINGTASNDVNYSQIQFSNDTPVACKGDIRTLLDYENHITVNTKNAGFNYLFNDCKCLTSAPDLPATVLRNHCYSKMFKNCISLTSAPHLPATTLSEGCYGNMFDGCSSLKKAPKLPATTLARSCYFSMFMNCSSLTLAPELPATTLAESCYHQMFYDCYNLTESPILPATKLTKKCYASMFYGCTNLQKAPKLPAEILDIECYSYMFFGCTTITQTPELPATTLTTGCYQYMFCNCTNLQTSTSLPAVILANNCYRSMFYGCSNLTQAPNLPATSLAEHCYRGMFGNCSNLTQAPNLPATSLAEHCYRGMFSDCSKLTQAPILPAKTLKEYCYYELFKNCHNLNSITMLATSGITYFSLYNWVSGVASSGVFTKSSAASLTLLGTGTNGIPADWTVKNYGE